MADVEMDTAPENIASPDTAMSALSKDMKKASINVAKPIPYTFDLGHLAVFDSNPLPANSKNSDIDAAARDCAQALLNQILTVCPIVASPTGVDVQLPTPNTALPREKPIPAAREPTTWEKFAAKKGIKAKKREGNKVYDEEKGEWVAKWGYGGKNKAGEDDWLVEVDEKKEGATGEAGDVRREKRAERKERVKRQERKERANEKRGVKGGK
ncbi:ribosomal biogenesis regulatory protein [Trichodelitschia bisporula]|uniref:Ribosome biogenesis regulatory protein n=1 Tax=Trichodelitschia bisporula TaxID=703511 RepID=A0A6G1IA37_9PEZI|nr:ribosomal biogenesis regulatory protein [Trichodelitschia bisporula]